MNAGILGKREALEAVLRSCVANGEFRAGMCLPSELELMHRFHVSRTTVRLAMKNLVSSGLVVRRRGAGTFVHEHAADRIRTNKPTATLEVGFVFNVEQGSNAIFQGIINAFIAHAGPSIHPALFLHHFLKCDHYRKQGVGLLIFNGGAFGESPPLDAAYQDRAIVLNRISETGNYICTDNELCGRRMAAHVAEAGHQRLGLIHYGLRTEHEFAARLSGVQSELNERGISSVVEAEIALHNYQAFPPAMAVEQVLRADPDLTAIICIDDFLAHIAYDVLESRGRRIPQDVSVIAVDDIPASRLLSPALTTVRQPVDRIGELLAEAATALSLGKPLHLKALVPPVLVERGSVENRPQP